MLRVYYKTQEILRTDHGGSTGQCGLGASIEVING